MTVQSSRILSLVGSCVLLFSASSVCAQEAPNKFRGIITSVDRDALTIKSESGNQATVKLADDALVIAVAKSPMADIKSRSLVAVRAIQQPDGKLRASEIGILPDAFRRGAQTFRSSAEVAWINGTVTQSAKTADGISLTVKYRDGVKAVIVDADTVIMKLSAGDRRELKPDAKIRTGAVLKKADGSLETNSITVGRDGLMPSM